MSRVVQVQRQRPSERMDLLPRMKDMLKEWYRCPLCNKVSQLFGVNEERLADGTVWRQYFLACHDLVPFEDDSSRRGNTRPLVKKHHWVPSLKMLVPFHDVYHACNVELFLSFETKQRDGRVTQRLMQRSDSYLSQHMMFMLQLDLGQVSATNIFGYVSGGTSNVVTAATGLSPFALQGSGAGAANGIAMGLFVGTGTTANSVDTPGTAALATPIANGAGAGQFNWTADGYTNAIISGTSTSFTHNRTFTNNSGASITITEVGLFWETAGSHYACFIRDVLVASVTVNNTASSTGTYTISITTT